MGGLAVQHWGEARLTRDADLTIVPDAGRDAAVVDALLARFDSRLPDPREFALAHPVVLLRADNGVPVDATLGSLPFEARAVDEARDEELVDGVALRLVRPSALVVYKVFAGRPQDWRDVEGIVARQGDRLDRTRIRADLAPLLAAKGDRESLARLDALFGAD